MENSYHFIGIGGIGMSALAQILLERGIKVTGSDLSSSYVTDSLIQAGAKIFFGHDSQNIQNPSFVVYSSAVVKDNVEYKEALAKKIPLLHRSDLLHMLMKGYSSLLVTGTHGKTTTSSLLAHVLVDAGYAPSFAIGGVVQSLKSNGGHGNGSYFVAEADESDGSFLSYPAYGAIITNIDKDHLDHWKNMQELEKGFKRFADQVASKEHLFFCKDDHKLSSLVSKGISYGFSSEADLHIQKYRQEEWKIIFDFSFKQKTYKEVAIPIIGRHNVLNAAAVFGQALQLSLSEEAIRKAFASFQGVRRRVEKKGEVSSICIYDDYAHHPIEILTTIDGIKQAFAKKRLVVAFQPHRYTRTRECMEEFPHAFEGADVVIMTDIYAAGEPPQEGVSTETLLKKDAR